MHVGTSPNHSPDVSFPESSHCNVVVPLSSNPGKQMKVTLVPTRKRYWSIAPFSGTSNGLQNPTSVLKTGENTMTHEKDKIGRMY